MSATRESILAHRRKPVETVEIPEWGGTCHITPMSGADRHSFFTTVGEKEDGTAALIVRSVTDAEGKRLFKDEEVTDVADQPASILDLIRPALVRVNGFNVKGEDDAKKN